MKEKIKEKLSKIITRFFKSPLEIVGYWFAAIFILWLLGVFSDSFLSSFFGELSAALIIATIFTLIYPGYIKWIKRAMLYFFFDQKEEKILKMSKIGERKWEEHIKLRVYNKNTSTTVERYYWQILIPTSLNPELALIEESEKKPDIAQIGDWMHWRGFLESPVFPKRYYRFPYQIKIKTNQPSRKNIYYSFTTDGGFSPPNAELIGENIQEAIEKDYFGKLLIVAEN